MITSKEAMEWYERTNTLWTDNGFNIRFSFHNQETVDYKTAVNCVKRFWRKEFKRKLPYTIKKGSGNRRTWVRRGKLTINPEHGWSNIVHDFGHWMGHRKFPNQRPHCVDHSLLEWRFTKFVFDNGYVEKSREAIANPKVKEKPDVVKVRYERMLKRKDAWEKKLKLAETYTKKLDKQIRAYEKTHGGRLK
jgi:hypothetical protein